MHQIFSLFLFFLKLCAMWSPWSWSHLNLNSHPHLNNTIQYINYLPFMYLFIFKLSLIQEDILPKKHINADLCSHSFDYISSACETQWNPAQQPSYKTLGGKLYQKASCDLWSISLIIMSYLMRQCPLENWVIFAIT